MMKIARKWFGPYIMTNANDNTTYDLSKLNIKRLVVSIVGERVKIFKKWQKDELNLNDSRR